MGGALKKISLTGWIFLAMAAGVVFGYFFPETARNLTPAANIFLRLIRSIIAPLLFGTLVYGIAGSGSAKAMGRIGVKSIVYFEIVTTAALFLGLAAVNLVRPGDGVSIHRVAAAQLAQAPPTLANILEHTFPASVIDAMARGEILQLVVFCFLFGSACIAVGERARPVVEFCKSLSEVMFAYTKYVMYLAPIGAGCALAVTVGTNGLGVLLGLGKLILALYGALIVFVVVVLGASLAVFRIPLMRFVRAAKDPFLLAFSTASSEAAFPSSMQNMERFGVPNHIVSFVLPTGYSFNLTGTTLYLSLTSVFVAQAAGIQLTIAQQLFMMLTLILTSKGVAGVPRAALVILAATLGSFNLPLEGAAVLLGIDTLMDMGRTAVNVLGNCLASAVVARWEGHELVEVQDAQAIAG
jgi:proton glutamate symport protein